VWFEDAKSAQFVCWRGPGGFGGDVDGVETDGAYGRGGVEEAEEEVGGYGIFAGYGEDVIGDQ
jgi:hypothetical protein